MADMGLLKAALMAATRSNTDDELIDEIQKKRGALVPTFEIEENALKYARRMASFRRGDMAKVIKPDSSGLQTAVFVGRDSDADPVFLIYDSDTKRLCTYRTQWHSVVID